MTLLDQKTTGLIVPLQAPRRSGRTKRTPTDLPDHLREPARGPALGALRETPGQVRTVVDQVAMGARAPRVARAVAPQARPQAAQPAAERPAVERRAVGRRAAEQPAAERPAAGQPAVERP